MTTIAEKELHQAVALGTRDKLTGLFGRSIYEVFMNKHFEEYKRDNKSFAYAMLDIDDFKKVNDTYGHHVGDQVLKKISNIILDNIRSIDMGIRYGGDEFGVVFPRSDSDTVKCAVERIRIEIQEFYKDSMHITVSCGISDSNKKMSPDDLLKAADGALYDAKKAGRNQIYIK